MRLFWRFHDFWTLNYQKNIQLISSRLLAQVYAEVTKQDNVLWKAWAILKHLNTWLDNTTQKIKYNYLKGGCANSFVSVFSVGSTVSKPNSDKKFFNPSCIAFYVKLCLKAKIISIINGSKNYISMLAVIPMLISIL